MRYLLAAAFVLLGIVPLSLWAEALPLAVQGERCAFTLAGDASSSCYLVLGSLAPARERVRVTIRTEPADGPASLPLAAATPAPFWKQLRRQQDAQQEQARQQQVDPAPAASAAPARQRDFHLFVTDQDLHRAQGYATVAGVLQRTGRHCQVYVDADDPDPAALAATLDEIVRVFDREVQPWASRHLGQVRDVDRDGRFTILLTPWLDKLQDGKTTLDGFVRGSDFLLDVPAPFSNHGDMMVLNRRLKPGPHLRTVVAHEYAHAVLFCEHVFGTYLPGAPREDEEGWLNEGIAHLVESLHGYGWSNLEHRIRAYLDHPERYPLVVPDYFEAGLWRTPGTRGSAYLFLRWCHDRHGPDLLRKLVRSNLQGTHNLEAATQAPFAELFRQWSVSLLDDTARPWGPPRSYPVPGHGVQDVTLKGSAAIYLRLPTAGSLRVTLTSQDDPLLQVTLVRHPKAP